MGKMPIPDDWDGVDWTSICIQWPNSIYWRGVLRGLLKTMSYGRFWDEKTGSITGVQNVGKAIMDSNFDFPDCVSGEAMYAYERYWRFVSREEDMLTEGTNSRLWHSMEYGSIDDYVTALVPSASSFYMIELTEGTYRFHWRVGAYKVNRSISELMSVLPVGSSPLYHATGNLVRSDTTVSPGQTRFRRDGRTLR